jgi:hypothetical protein
MFKGTFTTFLGRDGVVFYSKIKQVFTVLGVEML